MHELKAGCRTYQRYVEESIRNGTLDSILNQVLEPAVQGGCEFRAKMLEVAKGEPPCSSVASYSPRLGCAATRLCRTRGQTLGGVC